MLFCMTLLMMMFVSVHESSIQKLSTHFPSIEIGAYTATVKTTLDGKLDSESKVVVKINLEGHYERRFIRHYFISKGKQDTNTVSSEKLTLIDSQKDYSLTYSDNKLSTINLSALIKSIPETSKKYNSDVSFLLDLSTFKNDCQPLSNFFIDSKHDEVLEKYNDLDCLVVSTENKWGVFKIWLNRENNLLPVRVLQYKSSNHFIFKDGQKIKEGLLAISTKEDYTNIKYKLVQNRYVMQSYKREYDIIREETNSAKIVDEVTISDIVIANDSSEIPLAFQTKIPNGTPITVYDELPIKYIWQDGKPVKDVNAMSVTNLDQVQFAPPPKQTSWTWLWLTMGAITIGVLGWYWLRRRSA
jgi:hypothetical protein